MASRARGSSPSPAMCARTDSSSSARRPSLKTRCRSCSASMTTSSSGRLEQAIDGASLGKQDRQFRNVRVPFNERGHGAEPLQGLAIERPDRGRHARAVIIDQDGLAVSVIAHMAGEMYLAYAPARERIQIRDRVETQIPRRDVDIVNVAEQPAVGPPGQLGQKLWLWNGRVAEPEITRGILDQDALAKGSLNLVDMRGDHGQGLIRVGKREQMVEVCASERAPREVLRNEAGLDPVDQRLEPLQVPPIDLACAAEREADTVEGNGIVAPRGLE